MKHRIYLAVVLTAVLGLVAANSVLHAQPSFVIPLTASDNSAPARTIYFGLAPTATYCIDSSQVFFGHQEAQLPPFPLNNPGPEETRWWDPRSYPSPSPCGNLSQGTYVDFRQSIDTSQLDTFQVVGQISTPNSGDPALGTYPVQISWPAGLSSVASVLEIRAYPTGILLADMLTSTSVGIPNPGDNYSYTFWIFMKPAAAAASSDSFFTVSPDTITVKTLAGKYPKVIKRPKVGKPVLVGPTWTNLWDEVVLRGGFQPLSSESDSAGGMLIGLSNMFRKNPADPQAPKWTKFKIKGADSAWVRLFKWNFKKNSDASGKNLPKALENKTFNHMAIAGWPPRGLDSTLNPGMPKRKLMKSQLTKLDPKKTPNVLFAEAVVLKFNIAASQRGNTPYGFGELVYNMPGDPMDGMTIAEMSAKVDTMMTHTIGVSQIAYDSAYYALKRINRAFLSPFDTLSWTVNKDIMDTTSKKLVMKPAVALSSVAFLSAGALRPVILAAANDLTEGDDEDFEDEEFDWSDDAPVAMKLYQNFPNPFNPSTSIAFRLLEPSMVTLKIYNVLGQEIATLLNNEEVDEGYQTFKFEANKLASGVYFYRIDGQALTTERQISPIVGKMMLLK